MEYFNRCRFPNDVLDLVCFELSQISADGLSSFSLANKLFYSIAEPYLFRGLRIKAKNREALSEIDKCLVHGTAYERYLRHTRWLQVHGMKEDMSDGEDSDETDEYSEELEHKSGRDISVESLRASEMTHEDLNPDFLEALSSYHVECELSEEISTWTPLIHIVARLHHLSDFSFVGPGRFPPHVLDAIEEYHPKCRVHLRSFRFYSLNETEFHPDEFALATSPLLYSISSLYCSRTSDGEPDYNGDALLDIVRSSSSIRHVRLLHTYAASSPALARAQRQVRQPWEGFNPQLPSTASEPRNSLHSYSRCGLGDILSSQTLLEWCKAIDFSHLQEIGFAVGDESVLQHLIKFDGCLPYLQKLRFVVLSTSDKLRPIAELFFLGLPRLRELALYGKVQPYLIDVTANRHGSTLRKLDLYPDDNTLDIVDKSGGLEIEDLEILTKACQQLRSLRIRIKRSMGDETETKYYRTISLLAKLEELHIMLDCMNREPSYEGPDVDWDEFECQTENVHSYPKLYYGDYKRALVNSAVDRNLVLQIWKIVTECGSRPDLDVLTLDPFGGSSFGDLHPGVMIKIVGNLSRSWRVQRKGDILDIKETSKVEREKLDRVERNSERGRIEVKGPEMKVFGTLWPMVNEGVDWRDAWTSRPLR